MLFGIHDGELELRRAPGGRQRRLSGRFPYNKRAVLSDGGRNGRPRKEVIAPRAFSYRVNKPDEDIHLLVGHSYDRPLASRKAGTLELTDTDDALIFEAIITEEMERVSYVQDALAALEARLIVGISPGFRIPPQRAVKNAETVADEGFDTANGAHNAIIRTIHQALLYELSLVTRPAYPDTELAHQIEARNWQSVSPHIVTPVSHLCRWRL